MGSPRKARKKYRTPSHPWQKERLKEETKLAIDYGLKNKEEIWRMNSILTNFTNQSKKLVTLMTKQAEKEKLNLIKKLKSLGLLKENSGFEDILNLTINDIMERRLQTIVHRKGLAKTMKQSRQVITHSHIIIGDKKIKSPSYLIDIGEESKINFSPKSSFSSLDHPERKIEEKLQKKTDKKADDKNNSESKDDETKASKKEKEPKAELKKTKDTLDDKKEKKSKKEEKKVKSKSKNGGKD